MNVNKFQNYKPRIRGAAFTNKIMAKKTNSLNAKARFAKRMNIEQMKNADQVNMYGGLGKVGLDYADRNSRERLLSDEEDDELDIANPFASASKNRRQRRSNSPLVGSGLRVNTQQSFNSESKRNQYERNIYDANRI